MKPRRWWLTPEVRQWRYMRVLSSGTNHDEYVHHGAGRKESFVAMQIEQKGHVYKLLTLDPTSLGSCETLRFVYRLGDNYPGNTGKPHPGTNIQEVARAIIDRLLYLNWQKPHWVNPVCVFCMRAVINLLEYRAAERHKRPFLFSWTPERLPFDLSDGHVHKERKVS